MKTVLSGGNSLNFPPSPGCRLICVPTHPPGSPPDSERRLPRPPVQTRASLSPWGRSPGLASPPRITICNLCNCHPTFSIFPRPLSWSFPTNAIGSSYFGGKKENHTQPTPSIYLVSPIYPFLSLKAGLYSLCVLASQSALTQHLAVHPPTHPLPSLFWKPLLEPLMPKL